MKVTSLLQPAARFLAAFIFVASGMGKIFAFEQTAAMMASVGFPAPHFFLICAILIEVFAGLGLLLGFYTRHAAFALIVFIIPATIMFHTQGLDDPVNGQNQIVHLLKNISIMGGLLKFLVDGGGAFSLDDRIRRREIQI